jgi:hypothetical protein
MAAAAASVNATYACDACAILTHHTSIAFCSDTGKCTTAGDIAAATALLHATLRRLPKLSKLILTLAAPAASEAATAAFVLDAARLQLSSVIVLSLTVQHQMVLYTRGRR